MYPRLAIRAAQQAVGFVIIGDALRARVPGERAAGLHGQVGEDAARR